MPPLKPVLDAAAERLREAGVPSPRHDAEVLAAHVLKVRRQGLWLVPEITPAALAAYQSLVADRAERIPLQHLTGVTGFRHLELCVGPGVFIPRPETELLVDAVLDGLAGVVAPVVVDLCTGSGAVALSIAHELAGAVVYAVEKDPMALAWAERNAARQAAAGDPPITLLAGDITRPDLLADLDGAVDAVVGNPPYIPDGMESIDPEVAEHDPPAALWGGPDGLRLERAAVALAARLLRPGGLAALEHADTHGETAPALFKTGWTEVTDHPDLAGKPRYTTARRMVP